MKANHSAQPKSKAPPPRINSPDNPFYSYGADSPYWSPPTEGHVASNERQSYNQALTYFSASHASAVDKSHSLPLVVNAPESARDSIGGLSENLNGPSEVQATAGELPPRIHIDSEVGSPTGEYWGPRAADAAARTLTSIPETGADAWLTDGDTCLFPFGDPNNGLQPPMGRTFRVLTGGDLCEAYVDVSAHKHAGHCSALKVRPAIGMNHFSTPSLKGHSGVSKVGPLCCLPPFEYPEDILALSESPVVPVSPVMLNDNGEGELDAVSPEVVLYPSPEAPPLEDSENIHDLVIFHSEDPVNTVLPLQKKRNSKDSLETHNAFGSARTEVGKSDSVGLTPTLDTTEVNHHGRTGVSMVQPVRLGSDRLESSTQGPLDDGGPGPTRHPTALDKGEAQDPGSYNTSGKHQYGEDSSELAHPKTVTWSAPREQQTIHEVKPRRLLAERSTSELVDYWESQHKTDDNQVGAVNAKTLRVKISAVPEKEDSQPGPSSPEPADSKASRHNSRSADPPRSGIRRTASWFRDLIRPSEPYKAKLTDFPEKKSARRVPSEARLEEQARGSTTSRRLARNSTTPTTPIDSKFKVAFSSFEDLLNKAMVPTNEAIDQKTHQSPPDKVELYRIGHQSGSHCPPSVHESLSSTDEPTGDERTLRRFHSRPAMRPTNNPSIERIPKHYRSAPGMHSRNVAVNIPKRTSSLRKSKVELAPAPRRNAPRGQHEQKRNPEAESPPPSGCFPRRRKAKKPSSQSSLNNTRPQRRQGLETFPEVDGRLDDDQFGKSGASRDHTEGRTQTPGHWGFDGANDEAYAGLTDRHLHQGTDGVAEADESRIQHLQPPPPATREETTGRQRGKVAAEPPASHRINLRGRSHVSIRGYQGFSLARAYKRQPVTRDWSTGRKRFVATVACLSTAVIGILIGIYAGMVPSVQYWIVDLKHYAIWGNVFFYLGLAIPTFFFWPLPLLHGRKPYILSSLILAMPLLFPQAISVSTWRSPYVSTWRWALISSRAFMGLTLGFASMNFHSVLTDLFGASLMSGNPHQEVVDKYDVRRHGGGMGVWLGIWTWCFMGSLGVGFGIGAAIINNLNPSWGFYISIILIAVTLLLNVVCPEVRRSPFRRSVAEVRDGNRISRRVARGEVMMHRVKDGPTWWWQEVHHGILLSLEMLRQPGFLVIALYTGWIYAQMVLFIVLLGSLTSRYYRLQSPLVGFCVAFISIGALIAVPFQKANIFSRARHHQQVNDRKLADGKITLTSHLLRRAAFCIFLPLVGIAYTAASGGPDVPVAVPVLLAALLGFFSGLAISECNGLIMETFDTSDLQPSMTGRPRRASLKAAKRTNYSSFPRVAAGFAVCHTIGFILAAVATGVGGTAQRHLGQRLATGVVAGILVVLTLLLVVVLARFQEVRVIPNSKALEMEIWDQHRKESLQRQLVGANRKPTRPAPNTMTDAEIWRPTLMGNPSDKMRRVNILELGAMTRWTEIRKKNNIIDETAAHLNRAAIESAAAAVEEATGIGAMTVDLVRRVSSRRSNRSAPRRFQRGGDPSPSGPSSPLGHDVGQQRRSPLQSDHERGAAGEKPGGHLLSDHGGPGHGAGEEREDVAKQTVLEERENLDFSDEFFSSESDHLQTGVAHSSDEGIPMGPIRRGTTGPSRTANEYRRE